MEEKSTLKTIGTVLIMIIMGGILVNIATLILQPSYRYPTLEVFIYSTFAGGVAVVAILGFFVSIMAILISAVKIENEKIREQI